MKLWIKVILAAVAVSVQTGCEEDKGLIADAGVDLLYDAVDAYFDEYGWYPVDHTIKGVTSRDYGSDAKSSAKVIAALKGTDEQINPRGIEFIDPALPDLDPWGMPYLFKFDMNFNGYLGVKGDKRTPGIYAVWSTGPDTVNEEGLGDDIIRLRL